MQCACNTSITTVSQKHLSVKRVILTLQQPYIHAIYGYRYGNLLP